MLPAPAAAHALQAVALVDAAVALVSAPRVRKELVQNHVVPPRRIPILIT